MSSTVIVPLWLKSALQQGIAVLPAALQTVFRPTKCEYGPVQDAAPRISHVTPRQHAPVGCGHAFGLHVEPKVPAHAAAITNVHDPSAAQHATLGCGQTFGEHEEPNAPAVPVHDAAVTSVQTPLAAQHAKFGCVQVLGEQTVPKPWNVLAHEG